MHPNLRIKAVSPNFTGVKLHPFPNNFSFPLIISLFTGMLLTSCFPSEESNQLDAYFSIKSYLQQEIERLDKGYSRLAKTATINDRTERDTFQVDHWETELKAFIETDISRPAMQGKYEVTDSTRSDGIGVTTYRAKSEQEETQLLQVFRQDERISRIQVQARSDNFIYQSVHKLTYNPDWGFSIEAVQEVLLGPEEHFSMEAAFLK